MQESMERMSSCSSFGAKMVKYMKEIRWPEPEIDFDIAEYEEEND